MVKFSFPTLIHFGAGTRKLVAQNLVEQKLQRPLIVTDRGVAQLDFCKQIAADLSARDLQGQIFSEVFGNPTKSQVTAGVKAFKEHRADCIVGLGGGAALDVAKAIALMINHPGDLFDYEDDLPGARAVDQVIPYWVALPTTSGTGSEVGRSAVISDDQTHVKKIIFSPRLLANVVFADPELTLDLPPAVTAATGIDALTHCVEAYLAKNYHPLCDGIALEGLRLAGANLARSVLEPKNLEARSAMMMASMMGAIAFQKGLGVTHSCAHALGTVTNMHHGLANGVMFDFAMNFNLSSVPERFKTMAQVLELSPPTGEAFVAWLKELKTKIGIPENLSRAGVNHEDLAELVKVALADACHPNNPRAVSGPDFEAIFSSAF